MYNINISSLYIVSNVNPQDSLHKRELTHKEYYHYFHSMWSRLQKPSVLFVFRPIWHAACNCVLSLSSLKEEFMSINRKSLMDFIICRMYFRKLSIDIVFKEDIFTWSDFIRKAHRYLIQRYIWYCTIYANISTFCSTVIHQFKSLPQADILSIYILITNISRCCPASRKRAYSW